MKDAIKSWLAGKREYSAGVDLYKLYGANDAYKKLFARGDYTFTRAKLLTALDQLIQVEHAPAIAATPKPVTNSVPENPDLRRQLRPLYDERAELHNRLTFYKELNHSQEELKNIAFRIKQLTRETEALKLNKEGSATPAIATPEGYEAMTYRELDRTIRNLKSLRSKVKKNPDRLEELPALEAKIQQLTDLIDKK